MNNSKNGKKNKVFLFLALFCVLGSIVGISQVNFAMIIVYLALSVLFFYLWNTKKKDILTDTVSTKNEVSKVILDEQTDTVIVNKKVENHRIAGVSYRQDEIRSLGTINKEYQYTKPQLIKNGLIDKNVYEYTFNPVSVLLVLEPENKHDPNAIKVIIDNIHVGYIKKGSCSHVKKLINSDSISSISAKISGGRSKYVYCTDDAGSSDSYIMDKDETEFHVEITLTLK